MTKRPTKTPARRPKRARDGSRRGGARKGAGRKKGVRDARAKGPTLIEELAKAGPPPADELDVPGWNMRRMAICSWYVSTHERVSARDRDRIREIRVDARASNMLIPRARLRRAEMAVRGEAERKESEADPQTEVITDEEPE